MKPLTTQTDTAMKTIELFNALQNLEAQRYIIVPVNLAAPICEAANAIGMPARGGAYDEKTATKVIYLDTVNS